MDLYPFLERLGSFLRLWCFELPRFPQGWRLKHQISQLRRSVLKSENSSNTSWISEIITPVPFDIWGYVNIRWIAIEVIYNFCVVCFSEICIGWGQQLVLCRLLTPDRFYPKRVKWSWNMCRMRFGPIWKDHESYFFSGQFILVA
jgi:hypothetical protein